MGLPPRIENQVQRLFSAALAERVAALPDDVRTTYAFKHAIDELCFEHQDLLSIMAENDSEEIMESMRRYNGTAAERYDHLCFIAYTSGFAEPVQQRMLADREYIAEHARIIRR